MVAFEYDGGATSASNTEEHPSPHLTGIRGSRLRHLYEKNKKAIVGIIIQRINQSGKK